MAAGCTAHDQADANNQANLQLLALLEIKHVKDAAMAIEEQDATGVNDAFLIVGKFGELLFAGERQRLCLGLQVLRDCSTDSNAAIGAGRQLLPIQCSLGKLSGVLVDAVADHAAIARAERNGLCDGVG